MWGAWCKTLVGGFSLGEWEPLSPRPTLPVAACNTAGGLGGAVSPPAGSGRERILAIMYIKFASNNVPGKISVHKKNPLWGAPNCGGPGAAAPFAPLLIRHWVVYLYFSDVYEFYEFRLRCGVYSVGGMSSMICSLPVLNYRTYRIPKSP